MSRIIKIVLLILSFGLGVFLTHRYYDSTTQPIEEASVLLEKIEAVCKLVTVEGHFSEIYDYNAYKGEFPLFWDKKALIRVQAKVLAGYDLEHLDIEADEATRTVILRNLPDAIILSIDHDMDFYNIQEGLFAKLSQADYNKIQDNAKKFIAEKAKQSTLLSSAEKEGKATLDIISFMVHGMGWTLVIESTENSFTE